MDLIQTVAIAAIADQGDIRWYYILCQCTCWTIRWRLLWIASSHHALQAAEQEIVRLNAYTGCLYIREFIYQNDFLDLICLISLDTAEL